MSRRAVGTKIPWFSDSLHILQHKSRTCCILHLVVIYSIIITEYLGDDFRKEIVLWNLMKNYRN